MHAAFHFGGVESWNALLLWEWPDISICQIQVLEVLESWSLETTLASSFLILLLQQLADVAVNLGCTWNPEQ